MLNIDWNHVRVMRGFICQAHAYVILKRGSVDVTTFLNNTLYEWQLRRSRQ